MDGHKNIPFANPLFSSIIMSSPYSPRQQDKGQGTNRSNFVKKSYLHDSKLCVPELVQKQWRSENSFAPARNRKLIIFLIGLNKSLRVFLLSVVELVTYITNSVVYRRHREGDMHALKKCLEFYRNLQFLVFFVIPTMLSIPYEPR